MSKSNHLSGIKKLFILLFVLLLVLLIAGVWWLSDASQPGTDAENALESDDPVEVIRGDWLTFIPKDDPVKAGLIFYPGARVSPEAYADTMHQLSSNGYLVIVPKMPINTAILNSDVASEIMDKHKDVKKWAVGGHSLGGTAASMYVENHSSSVDALVLWASYPSESTNLSSYKGVVTSISATNDGLTTKEDIEKSKDLLPEDTIYVSIDGGNHGQFGDYGNQVGDNKATISLREQHEKLIKATLNALNEM